MNANEHPRYTEVKTAMLVHVPFFSSLLFDMMDVQIGKFPSIFGGLTPTAATDGKKIYIDEDFLSKLKLPEAVGLVCHEIGHAMWLHMPRAKQYESTGLHGAPFNHRAWNIAGDYIINDMLTKSNLTLPKGALLSAKYTHDMLAEDVYKDIMQDPPENGGGSDGQGNMGDTLDVHIPSSGQINEIEMKRAIQSALDTAKAMGKLPAALERYATKILNPVVPWQDRLRFVVSRAIARDGKTWTKPHRRRLVLQNTYLPAHTGFGAGDVVLICDTSGSIGQREFNRFFSECDDILSNCNPESVTLIGCDAEVNKVYDLLPGDSLAEQKLDLGGGGGTDFRPPFDWVAEKGMQPAALIYFTDMYGTFPDEAPEYPVIWCRMTKVDPPFGECIDVDLTGDEE